MKKIYIILSFLLVSSFGFGQNWQQADYRGMIANSKLVYINNTFFADVNGISNIIFKSTNRGESWAQLSIPIRFVTGMTSGNNTIYIWDNQKVYKSKDLGQNWIEIYQLPINPIDIRVFNDVIIMYFGSGEIIQSVDAGENWTNIYTNPSGIVQDLFHVNGLTYLAYSTSLLSNINGSFEPVELPNSQTLTALTYHDNKIYVLLGSSIYFLENNTWTEIPLSGILTAEGFIIEITINDNVLYAAYSNKLITINLNNNNEVKEYEVPSFNSSYYLFFNQNEVILETTGGIFGTTDLVNYYPLDTGAKFLTSQSTTSIIYYYKGKVFTFIPDRILLSDNNGLSYKEVNQNFSKPIIRASVSSNNMVGFLDNSSSEVSVSSLVEELPNSFNPIDNINGSGNFNSIQASQFVSGFHFCTSLASDDNFKERVYRSIDGKNWEKLLNGLSQYNYQLDGINSFTMHKNAIFYKVNNENYSGKYFFRSTDNGDSWELLETAQNIDIVYVNSTEDKLFIGNNNLQYVSEDLGETWQPVEVQLGEVIQYGSLLLSGNSFSSSIYISRDNGESWNFFTSLNSPEPNVFPVVNDMEIIGENLIVHSDAEGLYYRPLSELGIEKLTPKITSLQPNVLETGDTLTIVGENFTSGSFNLNEVIFGDTYSDITFATKDTLKLVVPRGVSGTYFPEVKSRNVSTISTQSVEIISAFPSIVSFSPQEVTPGDELTINGKLFDPLIANNTVTIGEVTVPINSISSTQIKVTIPEELRSSSPKTISVKVGDQITNSINLLTFKAPIINSISKNEGIINEQITLNVDGLSSNQSLNEVYFGGSLISFSNTGEGNLRISVPNSSEGVYEIKVKVNELFSEPVNFETIGPKITSVEPSADLLPGDIITIVGENFGNITSNNKVSINNIQLTITEASTTQLKVEIPETLRGGLAGKLFLEANNATVSSLNELTFKAPLISSLLLDNAFPNTAIAMDVRYISPEISLNQVYFAEKVVTADSLTASLLYVTVPEGLKGVVNVRLKVGEQFSNSIPFNILIPEIFSFTPTEGSEGDTITITGKNLGIIDENLSVTFGSIRAEVDTINPAQTEMKVRVPTGLQNPVQVIVNYKSAIDTSTTFFNIEPSFINIISPNGGEIFQPGDNVNIEFESNITGTLNIVLLKAGQTVNNIRSGITKNDSPVSWRIPNNITIGEDYRILISDSGNPLFFDESNGEFAIQSNQNINWENESPTSGSSTDPTKNLEISITAVTQAGIGKIEAEYYSLRDSSIISTLSTNNNGSGEYSATLPASAIDELGIAYRFKGTLTSGQTDESDWFYVYAEYQSQTQSIPYTNYGNSPTNYQIISVPLELNDGSVVDIFGGNDKLGSYEDTNWIMYTYRNSNNQNLPLGPLERLQLGIGYWLIATQGPSGGISLGEGSAIQAYNGNPHTISVSQGFNLIGNPYPFSITLQDLQSANPSLSIAELKGYNSGFTTKNRLEIGEGAFIDAATSGTLIFPVNSNNNGRFSANYFQSKASLDASEWIVNLDLQSGELINHVAGIGMHTQASQGKDLFDQKVMPKFFTYLQATFKGTDITKDIVSTQKEYTWEFEVESTTDYPTITLSWENDYFGKIHNKALVLEDTQTGRVINMAQSNSYTFTNEKRTFKIHFGDKEELDNSLLPSQWNVFEPYPVPFNNQLTIPIALPEKGEVTLELYDVQGKQVGSQILEFSKAGYHEIMIQNETASKLSKGVYLYRLGFQGEWINGKLSKE